MGAGASAPPPHYGAALPAIYPVCDIRGAFFESHELTTHHFSDTRQKNGDTLQTRGKETTRGRMRLSRIEGNIGLGKGEEYAVRFVACCVVDFSSADGI